MSGGERVVAEHRKWVEEYILGGKTQEQLARELGKTRRWVGEVLRCPEMRLYASELKAQLEDQLWTRMGHLAELATDQLRRAMVDPRYSRSQRIDSAKFCIDVLTRRRIVADLSVDADTPNPLAGLGALERQLDAAAGRTPQDSAGDAIEGGSEVESMDAERALAAAE